MGIAFNLLSTPLSSPMKGVDWLARKITKVAEYGLLTEEEIRRELLELKMRLETGEITDSEYRREERVLAEELNIILEAKAE